MQSIFEIPRKLIFSLLYFLQFHTLSNYCLGISRQRFILIAYSLYSFIYLSYWIPSLFFIYEMTKDICSRSSSSTWRCSCGQLKIHIFSTIVKKKNLVIPFANISSYKKKDNNYEREDFVQGNINHIQHLLSHLLISLHIDITCTLCCIK